MRQATDEFERRTLGSRADTFPADGKVLAIIAEKTNEERFRVYQEPGQSILFRNDGEERISLESKYSMKGS